jgi:hypothetical protein
MKMKNYSGLQSLLFLLLALLLSPAAVMPGRASTILWTNTAGGSWSVADNWSPNQVPGAPDTAIIPIAATNGVTLDTTATVQNLVIDGGNLGTLGYSYDTLTVNGQIDWTNGTIGCLLTNNGAMILAGTDGVDYTLAYPLYNAGTFRLLSGNLLINYCGYNNGALINLPGALLDIQSDASIDISSNNFGLCTPTFSNEGTIRKSGGTGTNRIYAPLSSTGTVDVQTGTISFNGGGDLNGTLQTEGTGTLVLASNIYDNNQSLALDGILTSANAFLEGADLVGHGTISGVLTWVSGSFGQGDGVLTVGTNGTLVLDGNTGTDYLLSAVLTNEGTIKLESGNLLINYCGSGFGQLVNTPGGLVDIEADVMIDSPCSGQLINQGIVRKSGGTGMSDIGAFFVNTSGILDVEAGLIGLTNGYNLAGGTLNFGVNSPKSYGRIFLGGSPTLSGGLSINLNNDYAPAPGSAFPVISYASANGAFSPLVLPLWIVWQTNYGATNFTLTVSSYQPTISTNVSYSNHQFTLQFSGAPGGTYTVLATTNLALPFSNWVEAGSATLTSNGLFQYIDPKTAEYPQRFFVLRFSQ